MTGGSTGDLAPPATPPGPASTRFRLTRRQIAAAAVVFVVVVLGIALLVHYRAGRDRRQYDAVMRATLDKLLTAQEGFFYDSAHYVGSLRQLSTVHLPPRVHVEMVSPERHSWWAIAAHEGLAGHRCVVWVGTAPTSFPPDARTAESEAKPVCFDDARTGPSTGS
jgi:hypothetical protein